MRKELEYVKKIALLAKLFRLDLLTEKEYEYQIRVRGEEQANQLLGALITAGVPVITFDLREPSLHEIFVEKVGDRHGE